MFSQAPVLYSQPMYAQGIRGFGKRMGNRKWLASQSSGIGSVSDFQRTLLWEQKRLARSRRPFVVARIGTPENGPLDDLVIQALSGALRETDWIGWMESGTSVGIIYTETGSLTCESAAIEISKRLHSCLSSAFPAESMPRLQISFETFLPANASGTPAVPTSETCHEAENVLSY